ncbi:MAG: BON domain-containing protein [Caldimicrobium sp.]|jgi:hyperosmotically inducible protein|uniref:Osmotically-inducible protein Y n=1 Tax=Caldimicrobium thiodismutans TaxID=1653476 RepID=A0A2N7PJT2_9BACT|nr:MAG: molecular chaperone OsmY [Caldimicrobium thiodismutans]
MRNFNSFIGKSKGFLSFSLILLIINLYGCGWVLVGGGAYEGYKVATDTRTVGTQIDDALITAKVKAKLIEDPITKARKIDVDTVNGVVTLTGIVDSEAEITRAIEIAKSVPGVKKVVNNLRVGKRSIGSYLTDKEITAKIKAKFIADPELKAFSIDVDTLNGVVTLTGVVERESQKEKAVKLAKSVEGVKQVIVNIQVKGSR